MMEPRLILWMNWGERLKTDSLFFKEDFLKAAGEITDETLVALGEFYAEGVRSNDLQPINNWLAKQPGSIPMGDDEKLVRNLIVFFSHLAMKGHQPFISNQINSFELVPATPDWSKLPEALGFLADPAVLCVKYPFSMSAEMRETLPRLISRTEEEQLALTGVRIRKIGFAQVKDWYNKLGLQEHIEASMVFNLVGVLDALNINYFRP